MAANIGEGRVLRVCDLCGGVDDHPRHVIAGVRGGPDVVAKPTIDVVTKVMDATRDLDKEEGDRLLDALLDTTSSDRHLDCCAAAGCPNGLCGPQVADAPGTGAQMVDHLMSLPDLFEDRDDVVKAEQA